MRKTALTAYGLVAGEWLRMTAAIIPSGDVLFVRADGWNSPIGEMPAMFRTSGDVVSVAATMVDAYHIGSIPEVALPKHTWKGTFTLDEICTKFGVPELADKLRKTYVG